jgi:hypothetical protein
VFLLLQICFSFPDSFPFLKINNFYLQAGNYVLSQTVVRYFSKERSRRKVSTL